MCGYGAVMILLVVRLVAGAIIPFCPAWGPLAMNGGMRLPGLGHRVCLRRGAYGTSKCMKSLAPV